MFEGGAMQLRRDCLPIPTAAEIKKTARARFASPCGSSECTSLQRRNPLLPSGVPSAALLQPTPCICIYGQRGRRRQQRGCCACCAPPRRAALPLLLVPRTKCQ
eukprot:362562-Chlamydomonas_euryale.AAC.3